MTNVKRLNRDGQNGAALIIIVFILAIALTSYILKEMNAQSIQVEHQQLVRKNLNIAKEALLAWAVANKEYPGQMPYPDRNTGGGYDGRGDCGGNPYGNFNLLIGQLPIFGSDGCVSPTEGLGIDVDDGYGNRLWYVVSPHLVHIYSPSSNPVINSDTINTKSWLKVLDANGTPISERVAAVIIAPGEPIGNQSRSNTASKENYLDSFQKNGNFYSNSNYDSDDEDFIMGAPMDKVSEDDASYTRPYLFNDQLVYITIDELMVALEKRVARQVVASLNDYYVNSNLDPQKRYYPYAAYGGADCIDNQLYGQVPTAGCNVLDSDMNLIPMAGLTLPTWFDYNDWEDSIFYTLSSDCNIINLGCSPSLAKLTVGTRTNVNALVVSTGATLPGKSRPSVDLSNYMDSLENADVDLVFDAVGTQLTNTYNDQMFIVAP